MRGRMRSIVEEFSSQEAPLLIHRVAWKVISANLALTEF
jgi:hypothetical protein